jgi:hypothetical protein
MIVAKCKRTLSYIRDAQHGKVNKHTRIAIKDRETNRDAEDLEQRFRLDKKH